MGSPLGRSESKFTFIDLFAGVGGFHLAMESLGGECVFASEIDTDCQDVYESNFGMRPFGDIQPLTDEKVSSSIPEHDVLCAGFPCQPFSKSGYQRGMNETRGTLFFNILKILEARKPRFAILENVRNLAGPRQRDTWETIIDNLHELGYRVSSEPTIFSPHLLPPALEGRPQVRDRVFILCERAPDGTSPTQLDTPPLLERGPVDGWDPGLWRIDSWLDSDLGATASGRYELGDREREWLEAWGDFIEVIDDDWLPGFPIWYDAFTPTPEIPAGTPKWKRTFLEKNSEFYNEHRATIDRWRKRHDIDNFPKSRRKFEWQARSWQPLARDRNIWDLVIHFRPSGIRVKPPTYLPALVAITQTSVIGSLERRITPREAARLQGFPDGFDLHTNDSTAYKQLGNAVNVGAVKHVAKTLFLAGGAEDWTSEDQSEPLKVPA